jgi:hypothetical protein
VFHPADFQFVPTVRFPSGDKTDRNYTARRETAGTIVSREGETVSKVLVEQYDTVLVIPGIPPAQTPAGHRQAR